MRLFAILSVFAISACNPYINPITTVPAVMLGVYDKANKRSKWLSYAQKNDVYAQYELANSYCCSSSEGGKNYAESFKWFCIAGQNGHARAQTFLGQLYENKEKLGNLQIPLDKARAYMWYYQAAKRANSQAITLKQQLTAEISAQDLDDGEYLTTNYKNVPCDLQPLAWTQ